MVPDSAFYGVLMRGAGRKGEYALVEDLLTNMEAEGLRPCTVSPGP